VLAGIASLLVLTPTSQAVNFDGHYPSGAEGIKGASLPPPGIYLRDYNLFYWGDEFPGGPPNFDVSAYAQVPRVIWMSDFKFLGANLGMDLLVPFYYAEVKYDTPARRVSDSTFAMGDLQFEPLLMAWHTKQFDLAAGYAFWAPSGDYNKDGTRPSRVLPKGYWSHMLTAGATWYPDTEKTWAVSVLNRYEFHMEHPDWDYTAGNTYTVEWGVSKTFRKTIDVGVVGYCQTQVTDACGSQNAYGGPASADENDSVFGIGPEISLFCPKVGLFTSLRYAREFAAHDRPEANTFVLTLTKRF
jgi:hypothetical protein